MMLRRFFRGQIRLMHFIHAFILAFFLVACGDDDSSFAPRDEDSSSSICEDCDDASSSSAKSSSSVTPQSSDSETSVSSSSKNGDAGTESGMTSSSAKSSSSKEQGDGGSEAAMTSSSKQSSSSKKVESSSSSLRLSSANLSSSSSKKVESSSSEYVPFDHFKCLADNWNIRDTIYKQFTDTRNGRSYYYFTAYSSKTGRKVTVMAENLNIGKMVLGSEEQNDDNEIERYCYDNDPAMCDKYGGLYQWAEMMQLPSNCNTESCWMKIRRDHQGICPDGWRLFTWDDFVIVKEFYDKYDDGITPGLRSQCFVGYNTSGFSLIGGGLRTLEGGFRELLETSYWAYPEEKYPLETDPEKTKLVRTAYVANDDDSSTGISENRSSSKAAGRSVRCVMVEK